MGNKDLPISMPQGVREVLDRLSGAGYDAWLVGGCLRDLYLGYVPRDWDAASSALPEEVDSLFPHTIPTGIRYGTVTVLAGGMKVEVTTFRAEGSYRDSRHPEKVDFHESIEADLSRRDFTINAMAFSPDRGWRDPYGGRADCEKGIVRCVGEPAARFSEDSLRMLRAVRFAAQLGFRLGAATGTAIAENAAAIGDIAAERIREELAKILLAPHAREGLRLLENTGLGVRILPEAAPEAFVWDPAPWPWDIVLRLCGLFCAAYGDRRAVGAALNRLRFDNATKADVLFLYDTGDITPVPDPEWVRRRLYEWGDRRMALYLTHQQALGRPVEAVRKTLAGVMARGECVSWKDLAVDGKDLIALGIAPGPAVGEVLERLMDAVLAEPGMNTKEKLTQSVPDQLKS